MRGLLERILLSRPEHENTGLESARIIKAPYFIKSCYGLRRDNRRIKSHDGLRRHNRRIKSRDGLRRDNRRIKSRDGLRQDNRRMKQNSKWIGVSNPLQNSKWVGVSNAQQNSKWIQCPAKLKMKEQARTLNMRKKFLRLNFIMFYNIYNVV